jgi:hypothetical protein
MHQHRKFVQLLRAAFSGCLVALALLAAPAPADACPTCKDAIAQNDPQHQALVRGYFYSILFMMSMPFIVVGSFGGMAYLSIRGARKRLDGAPPEPNHETVQP